MGMTIEDKSVVLLDAFTKIFCRMPNDYKKYGDLKFRCCECPFENHETGICAVKQFKCKYAPNYVDFGAMGDL